jgi:hypothetical protein
MLKVCEECNKEFEGTHNQKYCKRPHFRPCPVCNKLVNTPRSSLNYTDTVCSRACAIIRQKSGNANQKIYKKCKLCDKEFLPNTNAQKICDDKHYKICTICNKKFEINMYTQYKDRCSSECSSVLRGDTMESRFGVRYALQSKELKAKAEDTCEKNHGVRHPAQNPDIQAKFEQTCIERFGVSTPFKMDDYRDKSIATSLIKYGTNHPMQSDMVKAKAVETCEERYGVSHPIMINSGDDRRISKINQQFSETLTACGINNELEFPLYRYSYDIVLHDARILIELNPSYTHSSIPNHWSAGVKPNYHRDKSKFANTLNYRCIHIFDWDNVDKIISMLSSNQTVYARNTFIREVDKYTADIFTASNHLQGKCRGQTINIGLYHRGNLISIMTFGKPRYSITQQYELLRFCNDLRYKVVGGASKLFKYFISKYSPESIISYCNLSKFSGEVYGIIGMKHLRDNQPSKVWSKGGDMITDMMLRQRGFDQLFKTNFGKGTSNEQLMLDHGWLPVYDCGQAVYVWDSN